MIFEGSGVALVTPFNEKNEIDYMMLKKLIEYQISNGTNAIVILGTTGESSTITVAEREKIIKFCVYIVNGLVPVIVGTGSNSTETAISLTMQAKRLGADGALVVTPYYNKCNQTGLFEHYKKIALKTRFPIIIYNVPSRTGVNILPETVLKLSKINNIVGIKEASGNLGQISKLIHILPEDFPVYSGDDNLTLPLLSLGARGVISVTANAYPNFVSLLCKYMKKMDLQNAKNINEKLYEVNSALFLDVNPICIKAYMKLLGFDVGKPRLPLTFASNEIIKKLKEVKNKYEN